MGFYTAPNLLPGVYEVTASAAGFATSVEQRHHLDGWQPTVLNFTLNVGQVAETVQVTTVAARD